MARKAVLKEYINTRGDEMINLAKFIKSSSNPKDGFYIAESEFTLDPGGSWGITIKKGSIIKYEKTHLYTYSPLKKDWINRRPPIYDVYNFDFNSYGGGNRLYQQFTLHTKSISKSEVDKLISNSSVEKTIKVSEFDKFVKAANLKPNDKIQITILRKG